MIPLPNPPAQIPENVIAEIKAFFAPIAQYCSLATDNEARFVLPNEIKIDTPREGLFYSVEASRGVEGAPRFVNGEIIATGSAGYRRVVFYY